MQEMNVNELMPHPKNEYFFDDIKDENWTAFLESIRTSGVIEPIVIDANTKIIISGHQRTRACKELGIEKIMCEIRIYDDEDKILKDLLETNIRQRGIGNTNPVKMGRCIVELERIYGINHGGNRKSNPNNLDLKVTTQKDLANMIGVNDETLRNYKKLTTLIPELEDLVETGIVTPTTASTMLAKLSPEEQLELVSSLDVSKKLTQKQVQLHIDEVKSLETKNANLEKKNKELTNIQSELTQAKADKEKLKKDLINLQQQKAETNIVTEEVDSKETLDRIAKLEADLKKKEQQIKDYSSTLLEKQELLNQAMSSNESNHSVSLGNDITLKMHIFLEDMAKFDCTIESLDEIPDDTRADYEKYLRLIKKWVNNRLDIDEDYEDEASEDSNDDISGNIDEENDDGNEEYDDISIDEMMRILDEENKKKKLNPDDWLIPMKKQSGLTDEEILFHELYDDIAKGKI